jgi:putative MATE family efflux protein
MKAMTGMLLGNLLNVILDPIMILTCGWGIAGAAWATVIGNVVGALSYLIYFWKGESSLSIKLKDCTWREGVMKDVLAIGIPASLGSLLMSVSSIIMNTQMAHYGDMALAGIGVAMKVTMMTGMVCIGFGQGIQPLLGFCVGAKDWERYKKILRRSNLFSLLLGTVLTLICLIFNKQIVLAFLTNEQALSYGISFSKILLSTSFLFGFYYVMLNALQAMGAATESLIINLSRQGLIYIPALFILQSTFGINGLVWAQPAADVLSLVLLLLLYFPALKKKEGIAKKASVK